MFESGLSAITVCNLLLPLYEKIMNNDNYYLRLVDRKSKVINIL